MAAVHSLPAFIAAAALVIIVPGPATLLVAGQAHRSGWQAVRTTAGVVLGDLVLISLSGLGFATLMQRWPTLGLSLTVLGAAYVAYLGWRSWRASPQQADGLRASSRGSFAQGLVLTLTNPKPILFFGAFFPLFIDPGKSDGGHWMSGFCALGALFEAINLLYFAALIFLVSRLRKVTPWQRLPLHRLGGGGLMLCAAAMLATALRQAPG